MAMKCPPKYGQIYDHKGAVSTKNWCLPRALPTTEQQKHLPPASVHHKLSVVEDGGTWGATVNEGAKNGTSLSD